MLSESDAHTTRDMWLTLAASHMRVAEAQYQSGGFDFATFHAYHAFECALCALIAAERYEVPPLGAQRMSDKTYFQGPLAAPVRRDEQDARALYAANLITSEKSYHAAYVRLEGRRHWRNESLYVEDDRLPGERFTKSNVEWLLKNMVLFLNGLWADIHGQSPAPAISVADMSTSFADNVSATPADDTPAIPADDTPAIPADDTPAIPADETPAILVEDTPVLTPEDAPAEDSPAVPTEGAPVPSPEDTPVIPAEDTSVPPLEDTPATLASDIPATPADDEDTAAIPADDIE